MTPDRVAEALAALEAAEKDATRAPWKWSWAEDITREPTALFSRNVLDSYIVTPAVCATNRTKGGYEDAEFIAKFRNAAPALLELARLWTVPAPYGRQLKALEALAEAVLGPEPGQ